jgi:hypothetical protein
MKNIGGVNYLTIGETAKLVDRSAQTIKNWYRWCQSEEVDPNKAGLPEFRRDLDAKGTYHFAETDIDKLITFRDSISYGQMSEFNVSRWGQRGKEIEARKNEIEEAANNETSATSEIAL